MDGLPAVCKNLTCDFEYIIPEGEVTGFSYDPDTMLLNISGVNLPKNLSEIRHVEFAHSLCSINESSINETGLLCTLNHGPVCGDHLPIYIA